MGDDAVSEKYDAYLQSETWKIRRAMVFERDGNRCVLCNSKEKPLNCHHRTYDRCYNERLSDLTTLCRTCHARFENKLPPVPRKRRSESREAMVERQASELRAEYPDLFDEKSLDHVSRDEAIEILAAEGRRLMRKKLSE